MATAQRILSAALLAVAACGGGVQQLPDDKPLIAEAGGGEPIPARPATPGQAGAPAPATARKPPPPAVRQALVGEMCLDRGAGRPALALLLARQVGWGADPRELAHLAARLGARPFAVLSARGARAGVFQAVGPVDLGTELPALTGGYAGRAPCDDKAAGFSSACVEAQAQCGLAIASLAVDGESDAPQLRVGGACVDEERLLVDLDIDGTLEAYPVAGFLDEVRAPAQDVDAEPAVGAAACTPVFALPQLVRGKDAKAFRSMDLVGVVDIDDDGRLEVVMQYRYASVRTWAIYATDQTVQRLTLVGEVAPWSAE